MNRFLIALASVLAVASCTPKPVKLLSVEGIQIKDHYSSIVETTPSSVSVKNASETTVGFSIYPPDIDWTTIKAVRWKVENKSDKAVALWVSLVEPGVGTPGYVTKNGYLMHKYMLEPLSTRTITMDLPAPAPHPEVLEDFRLMYNNPYGFLTGFHGTGPKKARNGRFRTSN